MDQSDDRGIPPNVPGAQNQSDSDLVDRVRRIAAEDRLRKDKIRAETPLQLFIPGASDLRLAMPNALARSSLFAPIPKGRPRASHVDILLETRSDAAIGYCGEQLDETDADLVMRLIHEARTCPLGKPVPLNRAALLRSLGRNTGKHDYQWLRRRLEALAAATLYIEIKREDVILYQVGHDKVFCLIQHLNCLDGSGVCTYTLDPRWAVLFSNRNYALIDWEKRRQIKRGNDMAKALQLLFATSRNRRQPFELDKLKAKMRYASPMGKFRLSLMAGVSELERLGVITEGQIEKNSKGNEQLTVLLPSG